MKQLAIVSETTVRDIVTRKLAFDAVRQAFVATASELAQVFDVVIGTGLNEGEAFAIKSGLDRQNALVGFKCGTYWAGNNEKNIPAHGSTILLLDPESGFPQVLVSASYLNGYRTAAADAVAVSYLAREDASVLGVIGAGHQAEQEIRAVAEVRSLSLIKIFTRSAARADWISRRLEDIDVEVRLTSAEDAARDSDIVVTVTPSRSPLVRNEWIGEGTHISAMGADDYGKNELDPAIAERALLFAEYPPQSVRIGEFQTAYNNGLIGSDEAICALGLTILGQAPGRTSDSDITFFDSSGIAAQDLACASLVFEAARKANRVQYMDF